MSVLTSPVFIAALLFTFLINLVSAQLDRESVRILHAQLVALVIGRRAARFEVRRDGGFVEPLADTNGEMIDNAYGLPGRMTRRPFPNSTSVLPSRFVILAPKTRSENAADSSCR